jgi:hypothetical protein
VHVDLETGVLRPYINPAEVTQIAKGQLGIVPNKDAYIPDGFTIHHESQLAEALDDLLY